MSDAIFDCPAAREIAQRTKNDAFAFVRLHIFTKILVMALYPSKAFTDAAALSLATGTPQRQCDRVWAICIKHGVLRRDGHGYTARGWLVDNGFIGRYDKAQGDKAFADALKG